MRAALAAEALKLRRSNLWWITLLAFTVAGLVGAMFMFIGQNPDRARSLGLLGTKAQLADIDATWSGHLALLAQITAVGGLLIFAMTTIWVFGRDFADHTAKDLLALPTTRTSIVTAKFTVTGLWCLLLTLYLYAISLLLGALLGLPGWTTAAATTGLLHLLATAAMTIALTTVFALAASIGRGYLTAVGIMFLTVFATQIIAALGYGNWFPWSVPALYAGIAGPDTPPPGWLSTTSTAAVALVSITATITWWNRADHTR
jgi:ABC-2 type transport system permease protein